MAKKIETGLPETAPLISLTDEARKHIEGLDKEIAEVRKDLAALDQLGFDISMPKERLDFAEKARAIILERFG